VLTFELTVSDGFANTTDTVDITVNNVAINKPPVANAGPDQTVDEGALVTLNGTDSSDEDGVIVSFAWHQESGPVVLLTNPSTASLIFSAPLVDADTNLTFRLTVTDNNSSSSTDDVIIKVNNIVVSPPSGAGGGGGGGGGGSGGGGIGSPAVENVLFPGSFFLVNPLAKIIVQSTSLYNLSGVSISQASEGQHIQIASTLQNQQQVLQTYEYIVQISDENGVTVEINIQHASIEAGKTLTLGRSWQSLDPGTYTIEVLIWDSIGDAPVPLANLSERTIIIV